MATCGTVARLPQHLRLSVWVLLAHLLPALPAGATEEPAAGPGLTPPTLLADAPAAYPPELAADGVAGEVVLEVVVDAEGEVELAEVVRSNHPLFTTAALHAAPRLRFIPARLDGAPVPVRLAFTYRFEAPAQVAAPAHRPTGRLVGTVRTRGNRRPVPGALVRVGGENGAPVETDAEGGFALELPEGTHTLEVVAQGHLAARFEEVLRAGEQVEVVYGLEPAHLAAYETVVRGTRERTEVSRVRLAGVEAREVAGAMGDPFRVVMLMPGVSSVMSGLPYPVVRGTQPAATGYFVDGVRVPMLFHSLLGPAVVHPDFLDGLDFMPGTAPARYGRLTGGVVEGRVSRPQGKGLHATGYADLVNAGLFASYPFRETGTSASAAGRISYTPLLAMGLAEGLTRGEGQVVLDFYDYQGRVGQKLGAGELQLLAFGASDTAGVRVDEEGGSTVLQSTRFHRVDLRHRTPLGPGTLEAGLTWGMDQAVTEGLTETALGALGLTMQVGQMSVVGRLGYALPLAEGVTLSVGADLDRRTAEAGVVRRELEPQPANLNRVPKVREVREVQPLAEVLFSGAWTELSHSAWDGWTLTPGLRVDGYRLLAGSMFFAVEPRLAVRRRLGDAFTLKGGAGLYHQPPTTLIQLPVLDLAGLSSGLQESWQGALGAEWHVLRGLEVSADVYLNRLTRTVEFDPLAERTPLAPEGGASAEEPLREQLPSAADSPAGDGWSYGLELMVRHPLGDNWFGWVSYTLSRSMRRETFPRYDAAGHVVSEDRREVPFTYDQTHVLNLALSFQLPGSVTAGTTVHFNTGRPEFGTMGASRQAHTLEPDDFGGSWRPVDRDRVGRLPYFVRMDLRVAKAFAFDEFALEAYLDFLNVTFSREVTGFNYTYESGPVALPGTPAPVDLRPFLGAPRKEAISIPLVLPLLGVKGSY
ncbi:MAG: TonB family protein [Myxococcaceae bacterium]|nr:TonB family protein [Myxococcaceae bacterium]